jgi:oligopeptide/dipeptide ABC transporter ATP-binding protein
MGVCVERAPTREMFANPLHPYTKALLSAVPIPRLSSRHRHREILKGEVSSPVNLAPGCRFAPRCPYVCEKCHRDEEVHLRDLGGGHQVACPVVAASAAAQ